jgi:LysM repeat protein
MNQPKPQAGTNIYLSPKKRKAAKEYQIHVVKEGESLYEISQKYGIQLVALYDLNMIPYTEGAKIGMRLKLR